MANSSFSAFLIHPFRLLLAGAVLATLSPDACDAMDSPLAANYFGLISNQQKNKEGLPTAQLLSAGGLQQLSMSYQGSTGLLKFGSGYIYTGDSINPQAQQLFAEYGFQEYSLNSDDTSNPFVGVSAGFSQAITDNVLVGVGAGLIYSGGFGKPAELTQTDSLKVLFLLGFPVNIGTSLTITPELQWSQGGGSKTEALSPSATSSGEGQNIYGGVSIHFAY